MGKVRDLGLRKVEQISVLLQETTLKQKEIAKKLNVSTQTIINIKKKSGKWPQLCIKLSWKMWQTQENNAENGQKNN